jgi:soluble lytic murein transglycosylase-like protein
VILILVLYCPTIPANNSEANAPTTSVIKQGYENLVWQENSSLAASNELTEQLKGWLMANIAKYGGNYDELYNVIQCESNWNHRAVGDSGLAFSLAQFHKQTFNSFKEMAKMDLDYYNPFDQIELMVWSFSKGLQNHWTCHRILSQK